MPLVIPVRTLPSYSFEIDLDNTVYRMWFRWNTLHSFWTMDIQTREGIDLIIGVKLIVNAQLIRRYVDDKLPAGELIALDFTGKLLTIGRNDLGNDVKLIYIQRSELSEFI